MAEMGWIRLDRQIKNHWLWEEKPFDKKSAWIDLLLTANHEDKKFLLGNKLVESKRGELVTSEVKLAERWGWSRKKVRIFFDLLESDGMIIKKSDTKKTTLEIINYSKYQDINKDILTAENSKRDSVRTGQNTDEISTFNDTQFEKGTAKGTTQEQHWNSIGTSKEQRWNTNNNDNNYNNVNNENKDIYKSTSVDYQAVVDKYNLICLSFPKVKTLSNARKKTIKARLNSGYSLSDFETLFKKAESSTFLKGGNNRNWSADFDWLIKDSNMAKALDGKYDNAKNTVSVGKSPQFSQSSLDIAELDKMITYGNG